MEDWKEYKLSDIMNLIGGGTPKTSVPEYWDGDIPWISVKDFNGERRFVGITEKTITQAGLVNSSTKILSKGDVIISARGTVGELAIIPSDMAFNQSCYGLRAKEFVDPTFLYYLLKQSVAILKHNTHGSVFDTITKETFEGINIYLPPLPTQQKIAQILSSLDDKIELNNKINANLEQQAQALFKSWFVDFEPFGGEMPAGWKEVELIDFCSEIVRGYTPNYVELSNNPILNQKVNKGFYLDTQYYKFNKEDDIVPDNKLAQFGDVLLNSLGQGTLGRTHLFRDEKSNIIVDQFITILRTNSFVKSAYLEFFLKSESGQNDILSRITGSTGMWVLTINNIRKISILCPPDSELKKIEPFITDIYKTISNNVKENKKLSTLRDTLLPKLMNGEIEL